MTLPRISAIVVTFNSRGDVPGCLHSLRQSSRAPDEIIVVDNHSTDGTPDVVRRDFPEVTVLDYWDNPGFAEGNNRAFRIASGDYLFLLNPDATVSHLCVERLLAALERDPQLGAAAPKVLLSRERSIINSAGLIVNRLGYAWDRGFLEWDCGQYDRPGPIVAASGCAMLLRASVVQAVGGFDPAFFLYYEDVDLCLRFWLGGHPVFYEPAAVAWHAMKVSGRSVRYNEYLDHRNRLRTLLKARSSRHLVRALPRLLAFEARSVVSLLRRRQWQGLALRTAAWGWTLRHIRATLRLRRETQKRRVIADDRLLGLFQADWGSPRIRAALPDYTEAYEGLLDASTLGPRVRMGVDDVGRLGLGWHGLEHRDGVTFRWCCGYGIVFLAWPDGAPTATLRMRCQSPFETTLRVAVNGQSTACWRLPAGPWTDASVVVARQPCPVRVELFPAEMWIPAERMPGSADARALGVAVSDVELVATLG